MIIRDERIGDAGSIEQLTIDAFERMPFSDESEAPIVAALRADGDLTLSLVAEIDASIVGHVAISPVTVDGLPDRWYGLGPISVEPSLQRQGIGRELIATALTRLRSMGASGCALIGNPDVYRGSGFESDGQLRYGATPVKFVQRVVFRGDAPVGELTYSAAFDLET